MIRNASIPLTSHFSEAFFCLFWLSHDGHFCCNNFSAIIIMSVFTDDLKIRQVVDYTKKGES